MAWVIWNLLYRLPRLRKPICTYPACICELNIRFLWNSAHFAKNSHGPKWAWPKKWVPHHFEFQNFFPVSRRPNTWGSTIKIVCRNFFTDILKFVQLQMFYLIWTEALRLQCKSTQNLKLKQHLGELPWVELEVLRAKTWENSPVS